MISLGRGSVAHGSEWMMLRYSSYSFFSVVVVFLNGRVYSDVNYEKEPNDNCVYG